MDLSHVPCSLFMSDIFCVCMCECVCVLARVCLCAPPLKNVVH